MTNFEWALETQSEFLKALIADALSVTKSYNLCTCANTDCSECIFWREADTGFLDCAQRAEEWLDEKCDNTLFTDGEHLQTGQIIEVSDDKAQWFRYPYLAFYNELFYVMTEKGDAQPIGWKYARLPEKNNGIM